ncbi:MAG: ribonucleotide-diphosphate reductase subunit alpha [Methanobacterium sp. PtaU1.Bin242]|nr:MAG: ribonucleotide-diphosphate reductase subunit alpha [Methanobacterium sp. PtaU1.Bin242]
MLLRNGDPEGKALEKNKEELLALMKQGGVTHKGRVPQEELMKAYFEAGIWAYPTGFYEISCQPKGELVFTKKGMKKIENVAVGDMVLTHKGRFMPVISTIKKKHYGKIISLKRKKDAFSSRFTPEHEILTINANKRSDCSLFRIYSRTEKKRGWIKSGELTPQKDWLLTPKNVYGNLKRIKINDYVEGLQKDREMISRNLNNTRLKPMSNTFNITNDNCWLLGYFCAEGCVSNAKSRSSSKLNWQSRIAFASHLREHKSRTKVNLFFKRRGLNVKTKKASENGCIQDVYSSIYAHFLKNIIGTGKEKRIPDFIWECSLENQRSFIEGMMDGDGCFYKNTNTKSYTTISPHLAYGLRQLLANTGILTSMYFDKERKSYYLSWQDNTQNSHTASIDFGDVIGTRLIEKVENDFNDYVYDIEVAEDHSYVTQNTIVHNCITGMLAQACGTIPVVSDYAALKETVQFGIKLDPSDLANNFVPAVLEMFKTDFDRGKMMKWAREKYDINELAKEWNRYFEL